MKIKEILLEYNRDITIKNTNPNNILNALKNDDSVALTPELEKLRKQLRSNIEIKPEEIANFVEIIVAAIEQKDPTNHKEYTPWLVRMYSKGGVKYEDLNRMNMIGLYDVGKKRRIIRPEHKDINKFKTYKEFEDVMFNNYPPDEFEEEPKDNPIAKKVFEDNDVLVVIPKNEAAACKYGRNTMWCTAATRGQNYFQEYNRQGPLYILIPKKPKYKREKYQLHFETHSFMNEKDDPINLKQLLTKRFPSLDNFFKQYTKPKIEQDKDGVRYYYNYGVLHRENGPAIEWEDGTKIWYLNGNLHRENGPAVEYPDGVKEWWVNGERHREDGPAVEHPDGRKEWWVNGNLHREDGPAVEYPDRRKEWWVNGERHREDGPAVEWADGTKEWYLNGKLHREDGPAFIHSNGTKEWWINGERIK
jgi:hypothetical protein